MSIISVAPAVPNRLLILFATLYERESEESRTHLDALFTPPALRHRGVTEDEEGTTMLLDSTIKEARSLGLLEEIDGKWQVGSDSRTDRLNKIGMEASFRKRVHRVLFDSALADETRQSAFSLALSWLLMQSPLEPLPFGESAKTRFESQVDESAERCELTNMSRFQNFVYWARYLGFATLSGTAKEKYVFPDPSRAIEEALPAIFSESDELRINEFVTSLAKIYPVLETGGIRSQLEKLVRPGFGMSGAQRLSQTTSLALRRLADAGHFEFADRADAAIMILDFSSGTRRVSHVIRKDR